MSDRIIQTADLTAIAAGLKAIHQELQTVNNNVGAVDSHVDTVEGELNQLRQEFDAYVNQQKLDNRSQLAETRLVKIRQELDKKYGHYDVVRRMATGILQATDLGIIRKQSINAATEEVMLTTPGYWLAPALVALSAWICDKKELAERALKEALRRDDEKTSLFFALICRRAGRSQSCLHWVNRYLMSQDEEYLDRKAIIVLAAYANGLWGHDEDGKIGRQIQGWLEDLKAKPQIIAQHQKQWENALQVRTPNVQTEYPTLQKYSPTWPQLYSMLQGAYLHGALYDYFTGIFNQINPNGRLSDQLDAVLHSLVSNFDEVEIPLRKKEKLEELVRDNGGNEAEAKKQMSTVDSAFVTHKNFLQLLTDASMNPAESHADIATQKFAISLSKDWIIPAYQDIAAQNRSKIPQTVEIDINDFKTFTRDGRNEREMLASYDTYINTAQKNAMQGNEMTSFAEKCKTLRLVFAAVGIVLLFAGSVGVGMGVLVLAAFFHLHYNSVKRKYDAALAVVDQLEQSRVTGKTVLRACAAELVDLRDEYKEKDGESSKVLDFLQGLHPSQFISNPDAVRRVQV